MYKVNGKTPVLLYDDHAENMLNGEPSPMQLCNCNLVLKYPIWGNPDEDLRVLDLAVSKQAQVLIRVEGVYDTYAQSTSAWNAIMTRWAQRIGNHPGLFGFHTDEPEIWNRPVSVVRDVFAFLKQLLPSKPSSAVFGRVFAGGDAERYYGVAEIEAFDFWWHNGDGNGYFTNMTQFEQLAARFVAAHNGLSASITTDYWVYLQTCRNVRLDLTRPSFEEMCHATDTCVSLAPNKFSGLAFWLWDDWPASSVMFHGMKTDTLIRSAASASAVRYRDGLNVSPAPPPPPSDEVPSSAPIASSGYVLVTADSNSSADDEGWRDGSVWSVEFTSRMRVEARVLNMRGISTRVVVDDAPIYRASSDFYPGSPGEISPIVTQFDVEPGAHAFKSQFNKVWGMDGVIQTTFTAWPID